MTNITKALVAVDSAAGGLYPAAKNLGRSLHAGHRICVAESSCELSIGMTTYGYNTGKILTLLPVIAKVFTDHIPKIISYVVHLIPLDDFLGGMGFITTVARGTKEALAVYRQTQFLSIFQQDAWTGENTKTALKMTIGNFDDSTFQTRLPLKFRKIITGKKDKLITLLDQVKAGDQTAIEKADRVFKRWAGFAIHNHLLKVSRLTDVELERALPDWMNEDLMIRGGKIYINNLLKRVEKGEQKAAAEATKLLDTMSSYADKKRIFHAIQVVGAVIGVISCLALFITFPWAVTLIFTALGIICAVAAYMHHSGYVENREDRFSLKLCVPEALRNAPQTAGNYFEKIKTWVNPKKPKTVTPHPFFDRRIELVHTKKSYSAELLQRRTRQAAGRSFLTASAA
jgi:hypothetical protein